MGMEVNLNDNLSVERNTTTVPINGLFATVSAISFTGFTVFGLTLYVLFLRLFVSNYRSQFAHHSFYVLVANLTAADLIFFLAHMLVPIPYSWGRVRVYSRLWHVVFCQIVAFAFYAIGSFSFLIALNRFTIFLSPMMNNLLFSVNRRRVHRICALGWGVSAAMSLINAFFFHCFITFEPDKLYFHYTCTSVFVVEAHHSAKTTQLKKYVFHSVSIFLPAMFGCVMLLLYTLLFYRVFALRQHSLAIIGMSTDQMVRRERQEKSMLTQGFLIASSLIVTNILFALADSREFEGKVTALLLNWASGLNSSLAPIIYFTLNSTVQKLARDMYCRTRPANSQPRPQYESKTLNCSRSQSDRQRELGSATMTRTTTVSSTNPPCSFPSAHQLVVLPEVTVSTNQPIDVQTMTNERSDMITPQTMDTTL